MYQALIFEYLSDPAVYVLCRTVGKDVQEGCPPRGMSPRRDVPQEGCPPGGMSQKLTVRQEMGYMPTGKLPFSWKPQMEGHVLIPRETEK